MIVRDKEDKILIKKKSLKMERSVIVQLVKLIMTVVSSYTYACHKINLC